MNLVNLMMVVPGVLWTILAILIVKRLSPAEKYAVWFFTMAFALLFDVFIGGSLDLYDYGGEGAIQWQDLVNISLVNPSLALLYLNFLPRRRFAILVYTAAWIGFLLGYEWLFLYLKVMKYKGWSMWYSLLIYPFLFWIMVRNLRWFRHLMQKSS